MDVPAPRDPRLPPQSPQILATDRTGHRGSTMESAIGSPFAVRSIVSAKSQLSVRLVRQSRLLAKFWPPMIVTCTRRVGSKNRQRVSRGGPGGNFSVRQHHAKWASQRHALPPPRVSRPCQMGWKYFSQKLLQKVTAKCRSQVVPGPMRAEAGLSGDPETTAGRHVQKRTKKTAPNVACSACICHRSSLRSR